MSTQRSTPSGDFMNVIRQHFAAEAAAAEAAAASAAPDAATIEMSAWAENRAALGLGGHDDSGDFIGVDQDQASGLPDWRRPVSFEEVIISEMDEYAAQRKELGVRDASAVFGAAPATPRVNVSPWHAV
jgi:hypothetical protein